jgi:threonylcarbamoyladenosine tRNA methylthiotransferase MtaB
MHVFPYSPRPGTPAAKMPQVGKTIAKERAGVLRSVGQKNLKKVLTSMIGSTQKVLIEKDNLGRCENFAQVLLPFKGEPNQMAQAKVIGIENDKLIMEG